MKRILIDAHEDIAWNAVTFGRDYTRSAMLTRQREQPTSIPQQAGYAMLGQTEWLLGRVAVIFNTIFTSPARHSLGPWDTEAYSTPEQAFEVGRRQMDYYHWLVETHNERYRLLRTREDLDAVLATWAEDAPITDRMIGLFTLMEGADPIREPEQFEEWHEWGVRAVGPAWMATRYSGGAHEPGPLTAQGHHLLEIMAAHNCVLDLSHMAEEALTQSLERYEGTVVATHANPRRFCPSPRGLTDDHIAMIAERDGVVGVVGYNRFLKPGWSPTDPKHEVPLHTLADVIDHICQVTGSVEHVGIGSDFDGLFGAQHAPQGIDTVMDLLKLTAPLAERGYTEKHIDAIFYGNWLRILRQTLTDSRES